MTPRAAALAALAVLATLVACGGGGAADDPSSPGSRITFPAPEREGAEGTVTLEGRIWGTARPTVVLAHSFPVAQDGWAGYAREIAGRGFTALTFNFRGYGLSGGARDPALAAVDLAAAVAEAKRRGASAVFLVGASMGGTAAVTVAAAPGSGIAGVVALSAPLAFRGLSAEASSLAAPLLLIAAERDAGAPQAARALLERAAGAKRLEIIEGSSAHGTDLLTGATAERVRGLITSFLLEHRG